MAELTKKQRATRRWQSLKTERSSYDPHWREIAEVVRPRRSRFQTSESNRGQKMHQNIINGTATRASDVLAAGMMAAACSEAREWFQLTTPDKDLAEHGSVRAWLQTVEDVMRHVLALKGTRFYNAVHEVKADCADFGTGVMLMDDDARDILRCDAFPIGSYCLASSDGKRIDTFYREVRLTTSQVVKRAEGDLGRVSSAVKHSYEQGNYDDPWDVMHYIEPNEDYSPNVTFGPRSFALRSCWYEVAAPDHEDKALAEKGYHEFPILAPRWRVTGSDTYGSSCPGMEVLGDTRGMQIIEKRKLQGIEKLINPPMTGPTSLQHVRLSIEPGDFVPSDATGAGQAYRPAHEINPAAIQVAAAEIREHEARIKAGYHADMWLLLANRERDMTAREVAELTEEKMLQLGPVISRFQAELYGPVIDRLFGILSRNGDLPPPPEELSGVELRVEYTSPMAQAQKILSTRGIERHLSLVGNLAAVAPEVLDVVDFDKAARLYGSALNLQTGILRTEEQVAQIRAKRAKAQAQAQAMAKSQAVAEGAKTLSEVDMDGNSAMTQLAAEVAGPQGTLPR